MPPRPVKIRCANCGSRFRLPGPNVPGKCPGCGRANVYRPKGAPARQPAKVSLGSYRPGRSSRWIAVVGGVSVAVVAVLLVAKIVLDSARYEELEGVAAQAIELKDAGDTLVKNGHFQEAKAAYEEALALAEKLGSSEQIDPAEVRKALASDEITFGADPAYVFFEGKWLKKDEYVAIEERRFEATQLLKGLVKFGDRWVTPEEQDKLLAQGVAAKKAQDEKRAKFNYPPTPEPNRIITDEANMLSRGDRAKILALCSRTQKEYQARLLVLTLSSLGKYKADLSQFDVYAKAVFDRWQTSDEQQARGMLLLVAKEESQLLIEVGDRWRKPECDALIRQVAEDLIVPHLERGEASAGLVAGVKGLRAIASGSQIPWGPGQARPYWIGLLAAVLIAAAAFLPWARTPVICAAVLGGLTWLEVDDVSFVGILIAAAIGFVIGFFVHRGDGSDY